MARVVFRVLDERVENASIDLEDGEITDEANLEDVKILEKSEDLGVDGHAAASTPKATLKNEPSGLLVSPMECPRNGATVTTAAHKAGSSISSKGLSSSIAGFSSEPPSSSSVSALDSSLNAPDAKTPSALSPEELELAKDVVLDLLGWGVQPEYLLLFILTLIDRVLVGNVSKYPQDPRYIEALVTRLSTGRLWFDHPLVLDVLLQQFDAPPPPVHSATRTQIISFALQGVTCAVKFTRYGALPAVLPSWPAMWKWMNYLYQKYDLPDIGLDAESNVQGFAGLLCVIERALAMFIPPEIGSSPAIFSTPGVLELSLKAWVKQADRSPDDTTLIWDTVGANQTVMILFNNLGPGRIREIKAFLGPKQTNLGTRLLAPLRAVIYRDMSWMAVYHRVIGAISSLVAQAPSLLQDYNLTEDLLYYICRALSRITALSQSNASWESKENIPRCITSSLFFLSSFSVNFSWGHSWVQQLLGFKLVPSLLQTAPFCSDKVVKTALASMLHELRSYLIYRPIVKRLYRTITSRAFVSLTLDLPRYREFWSTWSAFSELVRNAWKAQLNFDTSGIYERKCDHAQVQSIFPITLNRYLTSEYLNSSAGMLSDLCNSVPAGLASMSVTVRDHVRKAIGANTAAHVDRKLSEEYDFPLTPKNTTFFAFLLEEKLKSSRTAIGNDRDRLLFTNTKQPLLLSLDYGRDSVAFPSKHTVHLLKDILPGLIPKLPRYHPLIIPCICAQHGNRTRRIPVNLSLSGDLFGWFGYRQQGRVGDADAEARMRVLTY
ncbi:hypothetical protein DXG01_015404 [Tephrocybe rancida]|nr:hypothetical protein DXG01_015404 [Tephrocybe rancida]